MHDKTVNIYSGDSKIKENRLTDTEDVEAFQDQVPSVQTSWNFLNRCRLKNLLIINSFNFQRESKRSELERYTYGS